MTRPTLLARLIIRPWDAGPLATEPLASQEVGPSPAALKKAATSDAGPLATGPLASLGVGPSPATLKKLLRKYPLDAFATKHLETLPAGLARLEAAGLRHAPDDGAAAAELQVDPQLRVEQVRLQAVPESGAPRFCNSTN